MESWQLHGVWRETHHKETALLAEKTWNALALAEMHWMTTHKAPEGRAKLILLLFFQVFWWICTYCGSMWMQIEMHCVDRKNAFNYTLLTQPSSIKIMDNINLAIRYKEGWDLHFTCNTIFNGYWSLSEYRLQTQEVVALKCNNTKIRIWLFAAHITVKLLLASPLNTIICKLFPDLSPRLVMCLMVHKGWVLRELDSFQLSQVWTRCIAGLKGSSFPYLRFAPKTVVLDFGLPKICLFPPTQAFCLDFVGFCFLFSPLVLFCCAQWFLSF